MSNDSKHESSCGSTHPEPSSRVRKSTDEIHFDHLFPGVTGVRDLPHSALLARSALDEVISHLPEGSDRIWDDVMFLHLSVWHVSVPPVENEAYPSKVRKLLADLAHAFHTKSYATVRKFIVHNTQIAPLDLAVFISRALIHTIGANISTLTLSFCGISKPHVDALAAYIMTGRSTVQELSLNHNCIEGTDIENLTRALMYVQGVSMANPGGPENNLFLQDSGTQKLTSLSLHGNPLGNAGACCIAEMLNVVRLSEINLNFCRISEEGLLRLAWSMARSAQLKQINLDGNELTSISALAILNAVRSSHSVQHVTLNFTKTYCTKAFQRKLQDLLHRNRQEHAQIVPTEAHPCLETHPPPHTNILVPEERTSMNSVKTHMGGLHAFLTNDPSSHRSPSSKQHSLSQQILGIEPKTVPRVPDVPEEHVQRQISRPYLGLTTKKNIFPLCHIQRGRSYFFTELRPLHEAKTTHRSQSWTITRKNSFSNQSIQTQELSSSSSSRISSRMSITTS